MQEGEAQAPQKGRREQSKQPASDKQKPEMHRAKHKPEPEIPEPPDSGESGPEGQPPRSRLRIIPPAAAAGESREDAGGEVVAEDPAEQQGRR